MDPAAAFWLSIAAIVIAFGYFKSRSDIAKHETLQRIIEKTGQVDEAQFRALFQPLQPSAWTARPPEPGSGYRALRIVGTLVLCIAIGLAIMFSVFATVGTPGEQHDARVGFGIAALIAMIGIGLHVATAFVTKPGDTSPPAP